MSGSITQETVKRRFSVRIKTKFHQFILNVKLEEKSHETAMNITHTHTHLLLILNEKNVKSYIFILVRKQFSGRGKYNDNSIHCVL